MLEHRISYLDLVTMNGGVHPGEVNCRLILKEKGFDLKKPITSFEDYSTNEIVYQQKEE